MTRPTTPTRLHRATGGLRVAVAGLALTAGLAAFATSGLAQGLTAATSAAAPRHAVAGAESGLTWASLTPAQQSVLAPLRGQWPTLDAARKTKWLYVAQRFPSLNPADQQRVQARMAEWARLTPTQRGQARQSFQELRDLPAADRQALWDAYQALPVEQRRELAQRAKPASAGTDGASAVAQAPTGASSPATPNGVKRNVVAPTTPMTVKPVSPTVVQAKPGATTTLVSKSPTPPTHNQPGLPKIAATQTFVNPTTLLPKRGPQGAATHAAAASTAPQASAAASAPDSTIQ